MNRIGALITALLIAVSCIGHHTLAAAVLEPGTDSLSAGQKGKIEFGSFDAPESQHWYAVLSGQYRLHPSVESGVLSFPKSFSGKVPAIVILHDSDGIQKSHEIAWAKFYNQLGYAAFVIDSFAGRRIKSTRTNDDVTNESVVIDAFQALKLLATHPDIDKDRIAVTGYSKGAAAAFFASWKFFQTRLTNGDLKFAAHLPVYAWCNSLEEVPRLTGVPMLFLSGENDTMTPAAPCARFVKSAKALNVDANIIIYPKARHSFDDPSSPPGGDKNGWNSAACQFFVEYENDQGFRAYYKGPWLPWEKYDEFWKGCFKRGIQWGYNKASAAQAHIDTKLFFHRVFGK